MILKDDIITYKVRTAINSQYFEQFNEALAYALNHNLAWVNVLAASPSGESSFTACVCKIKQGEVTMIHSKYIKTA